MENLCCQKHRCFGGRASAKGCDKCTAHINIPDIYGILNQERQFARDRWIKCARQAVEQQKAMLILGSGVSIPAKMPDWITLVSKMFGYAYGFNNLRFDTNEKNTSSSGSSKNNLATAMITGRLKVLQGVNVLEAGEYVQQALYEPTENKEENRAVADVLMKEIISDIAETSISPYEILSKEYTDNNALFCDWLNVDSTAEEVLDSLRNVYLRYKPLMKKEPTIYRGEMNSEFIKVLPLDSMQKVLSTMPENIKAHLAKKNTLTAVAYMLHQNRGNLHAMTYNYDTLVQEYLAFLFGYDCNKIVSHESSWDEEISTENGSVNIYHLHGCVPRACKEISNALRLKESKRIVFSEDSYYDVERDGAYNWSNSVQSFHLNRETCVFIGFSAEDYNFRRILRQLEPKKENRPYHYLILTIDGLVKDIYENVCKYHYGAKSKVDNNTIKTIKEDTLSLVNSILESKERYWDRYHIRPIWVTIPDISKTILSIQPNTTA